MHAGKGALYMDPKAVGEQYEYNKANASKAKYSQ
jgi:hypothetical protein